MTTLNSITLLTKALSDSNRIRIILLLQQQEVCVCHLITILGLSPSTVSEHLSLLKKTSVLVSRKTGKWIYYSCAPKPPSYVVYFITSLTESLSKDLVILNDKNQLKILLKKGSNAC